MDVMVYHIAKFNQFALSWDQNERLYRDIMRDPANINYVTIFRDPREQLVSFYYYFIENKTRVSERKLKWRCFLTIGARVRKFPFRTHVVGARMVDNRPGSLRKKEKTDEFSFSLSPGRNSRNRDSAVDKHGDIRRNVPMT